MSLLRPMTRATRLVRPTQTRAFTLTVRRSIKEDANRSGHELDSKKHEQIQKQKEGKGHWHEELASAGEANIAADRGSEQVDDHGKHMEDLQKETAKAKEEEHPHGKSS